MIILKSFLIFTLFITTNSSAILKTGNPIRFPDHDETKVEVTTTTDSSSEITATTESSTEITATADSYTKITTTTDSSSYTSTATVNLKQNQTESINESLCGDLTVGDYCTNPPGYPEENILKAVVSQHGILSSFFENIDVENVDVDVDFGPLAEFDTTHNDEVYDDYKEDEEFENVCRPEMDHIMPRAAKNTKGEFQFIVNNPKGNASFTQKVQVVKCVNAGSECGDGAVFDAKTECHQEFLEHKLVAVSKDGTQVVVDTFKFPSCCTCRINRHK